MSGRCSVYPQPGEGEVPVQKVLRWTSLNVSGGGLCRVRTKLNRIEHVGGPCLSPLGVLVSLEPPLVNKRTRLKTLPYCNFVGGGKLAQNFNPIQRRWIGISCKVEYFFQLFRSFGSTDINTISKIKYLTCNEFQNILCQIIII